MKHFGYCEGLLSELFVQTGKGFAGPTLPRCLSRKSCKADQYVNHKVFVDHHLGKLTNETSRISANARQILGAQNEIIPASLDPGAYERTQKNVEFAV